MYEDTALTYLDMELELIAAVAILAGLLFLATIDYGILLICRTLACATGSRRRCRTETWCGGLSARSSKIVRDLDL